MSGPDQEKPLDPQSRDRRNLLKSSAFLVGASLLSPSAFGSSDPRHPSLTPGGLPSTSQNPTPFNKRMVGYMLAHEQFTVPQLVDIGVAAEQAGFDLLATSDHLQPWQSNEGHSGEAWVTYGALSQRTKRIWMGTTVTCPTFRYNPAVVAEAFSSMSLLAPGRIFLGVGSGEALNEQAATGVWPKWPERSERLVEATAIIRELWKGEQISHKGKYYNVNAKLYDPPAQPVPLLMAANGPKAMRRAGQYGDGLVTDPKTWKLHKAEFEAGAKAAGKDPGTMPILIEQFVMVGDKKQDYPLDSMSSRGQTSGIGGSPMTRRCVSWLNGLPNLLSRLIELGYIRDPALRPLCQHGNSFVRSFTGNTAGGLLASAGPWGSA